MVSGLHRGGGRLRCVCVCVCVCVLCVFIPSSNGMPVGMGQIQFAGNDASVGVFVCLTFRESVLESQIVRHVE